LTERKVSLDQGKKRRRRRREGEGKEGRVASKGRRKEKRGVEIAGCGEI